MALIDNATAFWRLGDPITSNKLLDALGRGNDLTPYLRPAPVTLDFRIGSNNQPAQQFFGALAKWGKWDRLLTAAEKAALHAKQAWPFDSTPSLKDAAVFYLLDEANSSATYADATGRGNTLTTCGAPTQTAGPLGTDKATLFAAGDSLWRSVTADLQTGNFHWTICGWVKLTSSWPTVNLPQQVFWGQWNTDPSNTISGTNVYFDPSPGKETFCVDGGFPDELGQGPVVTNTTVQPAANTWYFVMAEYDPIKNVLTHTVNNNAALQASLDKIQQPIPVEGKIGNGSKFQRNPEFQFGVTSGWDKPPNVDGSCYAFMHRNSNVSFGNNSFTIWGWYKRESLQDADPQTLIGLFELTANQIEWVVQISNAFFYWVIGNGQAGSYDYITTPAPNDTNWHLFVCWYDKVNGKICTSLDNGAEYVEKFVAVTPGTLFGETRLTVGAASRSIYDGGQQFKGALNAVGVARGVPTPADIATLWNAGKGIVLGNPRKRRVGDLGPSH